eukprot:CAMPEP_0197053762 /NCGR_PEP_ID=MMETSP1384-20130603/27930_1 /TAXON_ID=29189 /ORGANISM="Ammonia sp." /LENGTH=546 /DNA_ID=CAMNT_0042486703 /DNA_START=45 /DNA_END=1685 /DNA_ORIENTATION=+
MRQTQTALFVRTHSTAAPRPRGRSRTKDRYGAHTAATSDNQTDLIRSRSQKPPNKLRSTREKRANSVGRKRSSSGGGTPRAVSEATINSRFLSQQQTKVSQTKINIEQTIQELEQTEEILKIALSNNFERLLQCLKQRQFSLESKVSDTVSQKKQILQSQLDELSRYQDEFKSVYKQFKQTGNTQNVVSLLNESENQQYNARSIQPAVSSKILVQELDINALSKVIASWGRIQTAEVPKLAPIFKAVNKSSNAIEVKCFEPKSKQMEHASLAITHFEAEYMLLPTAWKSRWKKARKTIFEIINDEYRQKRVEDEEQKTETETKTMSQRIKIVKNKNFKKNVISISDLQFDCDYLVRVRCYNVCGFGPWSAPKLLSIYEMNHDGGHFKFAWQEYTENMRVSDDGKTVTKVAGKNDWNCIAKGPCFPANFAESEMRIFWNVKINACHSDRGSLHFGIMSSRLSTEDVWSDSIGFYEYSSKGMEKYVASPSFDDGSVVKIVVDFKANQVEYFEQGKLLGMQSLSVLNAKVSDLCFGVGSYRQNNSITLM